MFIIVTIIISVILIFYTLPRESIDNTPNWNKYIYYENIELKPVFDNAIINYLKLNKYANPRPFNTYRNIYTRIDGESEFFLLDCDVLIGENMEFKTIRFEIQVSNYIQFKDNITNRYIVIPTTIPYIAKNTKILSMKFLAVELKSRPVLSKSILVHLGRNVQINNKYHLLG